MSTEYRPQLSVVHVDRSDPAKTTYTIATEQYATVGYVEVRPVGPAKYGQKDVEYWSPTGDPLTPAEITALDAAVEHYLAWAEKHEEKA